MNKLWCMISSYALKKRKRVYYMKKKKDNGLKAVLCLAVATIAVGAASIAVSNMENAGSVRLDVAGADTKIKEARQNADGTYTVTIAESGYVGEMVIEATYSGDGQTLISYDVISHMETPDIGSKVDEDGYKEILAGRKLPVTTAGLDIAGILGLKQENVPGAEVVLKDGTYTVQSEADEKGDYAYATVTVENGKVTGVVWDEITGGVSKAQLSAEGKYVMKPVWKTQSESLSAYVVENQTTAGIMNETGYTDAVSGVSINVAGFVDLVDQAISMANGQDGSYTAEGEKDDKGNYGFVTVTIEGGKVTNVVWDELYDGVSKAQLSAEGKYAMKPVWKTQSESLSAYVVENQTTAGIMNEAGYTDAVSGVSIYVGDFVNLANQALSQASENGEIPGVAATPAIDATDVDVVSGATFSSKAVLRAIDEGFVYLRDFILK